jgi:hypothetical protein
MFALLRAPTRTLLAVLLLSVPALAAPGTVPVPSAVDEGLDELREELEKKIAHLERELAELRAKAALLREGAAKPPRSAPMVLQWGDAEGMSIPGGIVVQGGDELELKLEGLPGGMEGLGEVLLEALQGAVPGMSGEAQVAITLGGTQDHHHEDHDEDHDEDHHEGHDDHGSAEKEHRIELRFEHHGDHDFDHEGGTQGLAEMLRGLFEDHDHHEHHDSHDEEGWPLLAELLRDRWEESHSEEDHDLHDMIHGAVHDAVHDAVHEALHEAVHEAVHEALEEALGGLRGGLPPGLLGGARILRGSDEPGGPGDAGMRGFLERMLEERGLKPGPSPHFEVESRGMVIIDDGESRRVIRLGDAAPDQPGRGGAAGSCEGCCGCAGIDPEPPAPRRIERRVERRVERRPAVREAPEIRRRWRAIAPAGERGQRRAEVIIEREVQEPRPNRRGGRPLGLVGPGPQERVVLLPAEVEAPACCEPAPRSFPDRGRL